MMKQDANITIKRLIELQLNFIAAKPTIRVIAATKNVAAETHWYGRKAVSAKKRFYAAPASMN